MKTMARLVPHRWLHPQTVPRGFLRLYILTLLSRGPETGYSMIERIEDRTEGAWRPGPGTMYPLLKSLVKEGLAKYTVAESGERKAKGKEKLRQRFEKTYVLTPKGRRDLEQMRRVMAGMGRKEPVMARLFSDLLPGDVLVQMMIRRFREGNDLFRQKVSELPRPERESLLKELSLLLEAQAKWVDVQLGAIKNDSHN